MIRLLALCTVVAFGLGYLQAWHTYSDKAEVAKLRADLNAAQLHLEAARADAEQAKLDRDALAALDRTIVSINYEGTRQCFDAAGTDRLRHLWGK